MPSHRGQLEGGLSETAATAGYFVLLREGDAFTAIPADEFYNFRPERRRAAQQLLASGKAFDKEADACGHRQTSRTPPIMHACPAWAQAGHCQPISEPEVAPGVTHNVGQK